jgi:glycopeptide antibiotics resistance protein
MSRKTPEPPLHWLRRRAPQGAIGSVLFILLLTLIPNGESRGTLMLVPFQDLRRTISHGGLIRTLLIDIAGNIVLFMPLGFFLPLAIPMLDSWKRILIVSCLLSISVETAQYILPIGRVAATTDVLLNTLGGLWGYLLLQIVRSVLPLDVSGHEWHQESA